MWDAVVVGGEGRGVVVKFVVVIPEHLSQVLSHQRDGTSSSRYREQGGSRYNARFDFVVEYFVNGACLALLIALQVFNSVQCQSWRVYSALFATLFLDYFC